VSQCAVRLDEAALEEAPERLMTYTAEILAGIFYLKGLYRRCAYLHGIHLLSYCLPCRNGSMAKYVIASLSLLG